MDHFLGAPSTHVEGGIRCCNSAFSANSNAWRDVSGSLGSSVGVVHQETGGDAGIESANIYSLRYGCSISDKEKINILMRP